MRTMLKFSAAFRRKPAIRSFNSTPSISISTLPLTLAAASRRSSIRSLSTSSTAYPSGSAKNPTVIVRSHQSKLLNQSNRTLPISHQTLPNLPNRKPIYFTSFLIILSIWLSFLHFSLNDEKANSSVIQAILFELKFNSLALKSLGNNIKPEKIGFFKKFWVDGKISLLQGSVDVAFRVTGSDHSGKIYFTSIRRDLNSNFEIIRWKLIRDDGAVFDLAQEPRSISFTNDNPSSDLTRSNVMT
ncbi:hypothetical protein O181_057709 [Austropuccinia psidii MF-1]|uniref:Uncharacterized protein n=1 Tax=Austropuccinia psidii MF-1 TaxID=1389203 RepID=A0A9Q3EAY7_9BASI|nr:hypothetical protein [Austropuccinia psidii MF-1]